MVVVDFCVWSLNCIPFVVVLLDEEEPKVARDFGGFAGWVLREI